jgi:hypothetical protein
MRELLVPRPKDSNSKFEGQFLSTECASLSHHGKTEKSLFKLTSWGPPTCMLQVQLRVEIKELGPCFAPKLVTQARWGTDESDVCHSNRKAADREARPAGQCGWAGVSGPQSPREGPWAFLPRPSHPSELSLTVLSTSVLSGWPPLWGLSSNTAPSVVW